jgi:transposase
MIFSQLFAEQMPADERKLLEAVCKAKSSFWSRVRLALSTALWRQKQLDNAILRLVILMNRF